MKTTIGILAALVALGIAQSVSVPPLFTDDERSKVMAFWAASDRYTSSVPRPNLNAPWQVRLTSDGSTWLLKYQQAIGAGKAPPTADPSSQSGGVAAWRSWVQAKLASDRWLAQQDADRRNAVFSLPGRRTAFAGRGGRGFDHASPPTAVMAAPASSPGLIPLDLLAAAGDPPPFAAAVTPIEHTVRFEDGDVYIYQDHTKVPPAYAYYRFPQGVGTSGEPLIDEERAALFSAANLTETQKRVMMAVSRFEGSFDAVNTYDTGWVSVGFLQFITLDDGRHSLADVLYHEKTDSPADFQADFRRYGIDLTPDRVVAVLDPATGAELIGPAAVRKLVDDKRLIAVFQRAGRNSTAFRVAQIRVARENYWPEDEPITVELDGTTLTGRLGDVIKSEAGLATFFDRKVNRGSVNPLSEAVGRTMKAHGLHSLAEAQQYEREIVAACRYRGDFLADQELGQPTR